MKNRHGKEYWFVKLSHNILRFEMKEDYMKYMRMGGREGQIEVDMNDLGMFDPPGGPYITIGSKIYWDEIKGASVHPSLTVKRIASTKQGILVEVESY